MGDRVDVYGEALAIEAGIVLSAVLFVIAATVNFAAPVQKHAREFPSAR
jgi:hypothetical protein